MPTLSDPKLAITVATGSGNATVTVSVDVSFTQGEKSLMGVFPDLDYIVTCKAIGADSGSDDDNLFQVGSARIRDDQNDLTFSRLVAKSELDEDNPGDDEIYARFTCVPNPEFPLEVKPAEPVNSAEVHGSF